MKCFARWHEDKSGLCFRDQTILQYGDSWELLVNIVLLNPGSAKPLDNIPQDEFLKSKNLPFFIDCDNYTNYYRFNVDQLMGYLIQFYSSKYSGGVIKMYNLFNLKNPKSDDAIKQYNKHQSKRRMHTKADDILFCEKDVVIATGKNAFKNQRLKKELKKYISLANKNRLFALNPISEDTYAIIASKPEKDGLIQSYHPSFTFKYGNTTLLNE